MDDAASRYKEILEDQAHIAQALCWTVVQPVTRPLTIGDVVRRLDGDPDALRPHQLADAYDVGDGGGDLQLVHCAQIGPAVVLFETNGFQGSRPEVLRRLSDGARVHSAYWNVNMTNRLSFAVYGRTLATVDAQDPDRCHGDQPDSIEDDLAALRTDRPPGDTRALMLAFVERRTGVALDAAWFRRPHPAVVVRAVPRDPRPPGLFAAVDPDLDSLLRLATELDRQAALGWLAGHLAAEFDLLDDPAVRDTVDAVRRGLPVDSRHQQALVSVRQRLDADYRSGPDPRGVAENPVWRRMQAGIAISQAVEPADGSWDDPLNALYHARLALADGWPPVRSRLRDLAPGRR